MAIGILMLLVALVLAVAAKKSPRSVLLWAFGGAVVGGLVGAIGLLPLFGGTGIGIGLGIGAAVGFVQSLRHTPGKPAAPPFEATHRHDNLAINADKNLVWVRDEHGREYTLEAREIRQWNHLWVPDRGYKAQNRIELRTSRVDSPVLVVPFRRHSATVWGAPKNARECEEWHGRLSAFLDR